MQEVPAMPHLLTVKFNAKSQMYQGVSHFILDHQWVTDQIVNTLPGGERRADAAQGPDQGLQELLRVGHQRQGRIIYIIL